MNSQSQPPCGGIIGFRRQDVNAVRQRRASTKVDDSLRSQVMAANSFADSPKPKVRLNSGVLFHIKLQIIRSINIGRMKKLSREKSM